MIQSYFVYIMPSLCLWCYFLHLQLLGELLESMALGKGKDGADFVAAEDVCWKHLFSYLHIL